MQDIIPPSGGHRPKIVTHVAREEHEGMENTGDAAVVDAGTEVDGATAVNEESVGSTPVGAVGELGEAALDLSGVEDLAEGTVEARSDDGDPTPDTAIEDVALAEEVAYAEKPFRDAQVEQKDKLTPENQELLDWLASEAAEKTIAKYIEARGQVSEVEQVLREKAAEISRMFTGDIAIFARHNTRLGMNEEESVAITEDTQALLSKIVGLELEKILANPDLSDKERLGKISSLHAIRERAIDVLGKMQEINGESEMVRSYEQYGNSRERIVNLLWGQVAVTVAAGYPAAVVSALELIAERTREDVTDLIDSIMPEIVKGKSEHNVAFQGNNDRIMEGYGYVWSQTRKTYVKVAN